MRELLSSISTHLRDRRELEPWERHAKSSFGDLSAEDQAYVDGLAQKVNAGTLATEDILSLGDRRLTNAENAAKRAGQNGRRLARSLADQSVAYYTGLHAGPGIDDVMYRAVQIKKGEPPTP